VSIIKGLLDSLLRWMEYDCQNCQQNNKEVASQRAASDEKIKRILFSRLFSKSCGLMISEKVRVLRACAGIKGYNATDPGGEGGNFWLLFLYEVSRVSCFSLKYYIICARTSNVL
jgi:hypothetical protein